jgi:hypothetical protein
VDILFIPHKQALFIKYLPNSSKMGGFGKKVSLEEGFFEQ